MTTERKTELARQLVAIIFELTSAGEVPTDVMPVEQPKKPVEMLTLKESCLELIEQGLTTSEELVKVAYYD